MSKTVLRGYISNLDDTRSDFSIEFQEGFIPSAPLVLPDPDAVHINTLTPEQIAVETRQIIIEPNNPNHNFDLIRGIDIVHQGVLAINTPGASHGLNIFKGVSGSALGTTYNIATSIPTEGVLKASVTAGASTLIVSTVSYGVTLATAPVLGPVAPVAGLAASYLLDPIVNDLVDLSYDRAGDSFNSISTFLNSSNELNVRNGDLYEVNLVFESYQDYINWQLNNPMPYRDLLSTQEVSPLDINNFDISVGGQSIFGNLIDSDLPPIFTDNLRLIEGISFRNDGSQQQSVFIQYKNQIIGEGKLADDGSLSISALSGTGEYVTHPDVLTEATRALGSPEANTVKVNYGDHRSEKTIQRDELTQSKALSDGFMESTELSEGLYSAILDTSQNTEGTTDANMTLSRRTVNGNQIEATVDFTSGNGESFKSLEMTLDIALDDIDIRILDDNGQLIDSLSISGDTMTVQGQSLSQPGVVNATSVGGWTDFLEEALSLELTDDLTLITQNKVDGSLNGHFNYAEIALGDVDPDGQQTAQAIATEQTRLDAFNVQRLGADPGLLGQLFRTTALDQQLNVVRHHDLNLGNLIRQESVFGQVVPQSFNNPFTDNFGAYYEAQPVYDETASIEHLVPRLYLNGQLLDHATIRGLDYTGDGYLDSQDFWFTSLTAWVDNNADGIQEASELQALSYSRLDVEQAEIFNTLAPITPVSSRYGLPANFVFGPEDDVLINSDQSHVFYTGAGNDTLFLNGGFDVAFGEEGVDTILGGWGDDWIEGGGDFNLLIGEAGHDVLIGGDDSNELNGYAIPWTLVEQADGTLLISDIPNPIFGDPLPFGEGDNDLLIGGNAYDQILGQFGDDILLANGGDDNLFGGIGNDIVIGGEGSDNVQGFRAFDDLFPTIHPGESDDDWLFGGNGTDLLLGDADLVDSLNNDRPIDGTYAPRIGGRDYLDGGAGADRMAGGGGDDTYVVNTLNDLVIERLDEGHDTVLSSVTYLLNQGVEDLYLLGESQIHGTGNKLDNKLVGNIANNILDGVTGDDQMLGGLGDDLYYVDSQGDQVIERANAGNDTVWSSTDHTLAENVENLELLSFSKPEPGSIGGQTVQVYGYPKRYELDYRQGDTYQAYTGSCGLTAAANILIMAGRLTISEQETIDYAFEQYLTHTDFQPELSGATTALQQVQLLNGLGLPSTSAFGYDANYLAELVRLGHGVVLGVNAGNLWNEPQFQDGQVNHAVTVTGVAYSEATQELLGFYIADSGRGYVSDMSRYVPLAEFEAAANVHGAYLAYTLDAVKVWATDFDGTGNELNNTLIGNEGSNVLDGATGADVMEGRAGDDTYHVDNAGDQVIEQANEGRDRVVVGFDWTLSEHVEDVTLTGAAHLNATGNNSDNDLVGNEGNNTLFAHGGDDELDGQAGDDILNGGDGNDVLRGGEGNDDLDGWLGDDILIGGEGDDALHGFTGVDILDGGAGNDTLFSYGDATVYGGEGDDQIGIGGVAEAYGEGGNDTVFTSGGGTYRGGAGNEYMENHGSAKFYGDSGDDILLNFSQLGTELDGGSGNDTVLNYAGSSLLMGGDGNDELLFLNDSSGTAWGGEGDDTLKSFAQSTLFGDGGNDTLENNAAGSQLFSGDGDDALWSFADGNLIAGNGNDLLVSDSQTANGVLLGEAGDDQLINFKGASVLDGGFGNDTFDVHSVTTALGGSGNDTFTNYSTQAATLDGGSGSDTFTNQSNAVATIRTGADSDTATSLYGASTVFEMNSGDGYDTLFDFDTGLNEDVLRFGSGLDNTDVAIYRHGSELVLKYGQSDQVTVMWQDGVAGSLERYELDNGLFMTNSEINQLVSDLNSYASNNGIALNTVDDVANDAQLMQLVSAAWHS